tara:strand:+ start:1539 stop:2018 length:480 start_codon:yes stop_codon:yes gene_type:complete
MFKESSVVLLHEYSTDNLILTKRSETLRNHPGDYCFPGGLRDRCDKNLWDTATRELNEELGIKPHRITLVKALKPESTLQGKLIYPWLAVIDSIRPYQLNPFEVTDILALSISDVKKKTNYKSLEVKHGNIIFNSCEYIGCKQNIWGATAKIMQQLCDE